MKKELIFLFISFLIPVIFILSLWGYFSYTTTKIKPQYDFVYAASFNPYYDYSNGKQAFLNPFNIKEDGQLGFTYCSDNSASNTNSEYPYTGNTNSCQFQEKPENFMYYRYSISNKTSSIITYGDLKSIKFYRSQQSPDGFTFVGDVNSQSEVFQNQNIFTSVGGIQLSNKALLKDNSGISIQINLNQDVYNRLFIGWINPN